MAFIKPPDDGSLLDETATAAAVTTRRA